MRLEVEGLSAGYGRQAILFEVNVHFQGGEVSAIIGPNGAGKSTLLKAIFGLVQIHGGTIQLDGEVLRSIQPERMARRGIAYVPQLENIFPSLSVRENLEIGTYVRPGGSWDHVLGLFPDLRAVLRKSAGTLSGGQRNMLAVARALMGRPSVLMVDEPSAGLSPMIADDLWKHLRKLAESGIAVVVVEQNVQLALEYSDDVYLLASGRNRIHESSAEFAQRTNFEALFLESSEAADAS